MEESQTMEPLIAAMGRALKCLICLEDDKELKILTCCGKLVCLPCIKKEFLDKDDKELHGGTPVCRFCQKTPAGNSEKYPVSRIAQHFQEWVTTLKSRGTKATCQADDCTALIQKHCKYCKEFLCERCSLKGCLAADGEHETTEIADCIAGSKQTYLLWKESKEQELKGLVAKLNETFSTIKEQGLILSKATDDPLAEELRKTFSLLSKAQTQLGEVHEKMVKVKANLNFVVGSFEEVSDNDLVYLVNQLELCEKIRRVTIGKFQPLLEDYQQCYDVVLSPAGHLVVARNGGVDIVDISNSQKPEVIKSMLRGGHAFSLAVYKSTVIVGMQPERISFEVQVVTLNENYEEVKSWNAKLFPCDLAVVQDKIIFTDQRNPNLKAFTISGTALPEIMWNGASAGITGVSSSSIALADHKYNKVYRKNLSTGNIQWSAAVESPFSMCVDTQQNIWIRSNDKKCITILTPKGEKLQEIDMKSVTSVEHWTGIMIHDGYMYFCHREGMGRLPLIYHHD